MTEQQEELRREIIDSRILNGLMTQLKNSNSEDKITKVMKSILLLCTSLEKGENLDKVINFITHSLQKESLELYQYNQILKLFEKFQIPLKVQERLYFRAGIDSFNKAAEAFIAYGQEHKIPFAILFKLLATILSIAASELLGDKYHEEVTFNNKPIIQDIINNSSDQENLIENYSLLLEELELLAHMIVLEQNLAQEQETELDLWNSFNLTKKLKKLIASKKGSKSELLAKKLQKINLGIESKYKTLETNLIIKLLKDKALLGILNNQDYIKLLSRQIEKKTFPQENIFTTDLLDKIFRTRGLAKARKGLTAIIPQEKLSTAAIKYLVGEVRKIIIREKRREQFISTNNIGPLVTT
jgi:hypothetical protein